MIFINRLLQAVEKSGFTSMDAANWFDIAYPTMWQWLHGGRRITDDRAESLLAPLERLEFAIKGGAFPVPFRFSRKNRASYLKAIRDGSSRAHLLAADTADGGLLLRSRARR